MAGHYSYSTTPGQRKILVWKFQFHRHLKELKKLSKTFDLCDSKSFEFLDLVFHREIKGFSVFLIHSTRIIT
jgi:hypothetical protein